MLSNKPAAHVSFLCLTFSLMTKVMYEGMMSIESEIDRPDAKDAEIFAQFPEVFRYPQHLEFMCDALRLMVSGMPDVTSLSFFAATAKKSFMDNGGKDESLWDCIWAALYAIASGSGPSLAVEYGRQAIPVKLRPTFLDLEALLKSKVGYRGRPAGCEPATRESMDMAIDALFARLDAET